jgi:hypothetical protein
VGGVGAGPPLVLAPTRRCNLTGEKGNASSDSVLVACGNSRARRCCFRRIPASLVDYSPKKATGKRTIKPLTRLMRRLSQANVDKFAAAITPYVDAGQRVDGRRTSTSSSKSSARVAGQVDTKAVGKWAVANGIELSSRGRVPAAVIEKYRAGRQLERALARGRRPRHLGPVAPASVRSPTRGAIRGANCSCPGCLYISRGANSVTRVASQGQSYRRKGFS